MIGAVSRSCGDGRAAGILTRRVLVPALSAAMAVGVVIIGAAGTAVAVSPSPAAAVPAAAVPTVAAVATRGKQDPEDKWGDPKADKAAKDDAGKYDAKKDPGSMATVSAAIGAYQVWKEEKLTGQGVTVAVLDTGVQAVPGLDGPAKVIQGPDLSLEANSDQLLADDTYGHGTHLAGIIAGRDDTKVGKEPKGDDFAGIAPDARILALKLASTDGSADVSQIIAGLDWVTQHAADPGLDVRVVNLSFGTNSLQPYEIDPLAAAAENAWRHDIVVVVSAGNDGSDFGMLTDPAIDPYVIAVGASDPQGSVKGWQKPVAADFSSRGTSQRPVDLVAPGRSLVSLRNPGSTVDVQHPEGLVVGDDSGRLFRGSGTSQAAAVVSGSVALLLDADPGLTPDQVKAVLTETAAPMPASDPLVVGAGQVDVEAAVKAVHSRKGSPAWRTSVQTWPAAQGTGSLELARGDAHLFDAETGQPLVGEVDVQSQPWDGARWSADSFAARAWTDGDWNGARWSGARWSGARWSSTSWDGARWSGARWSGARWSGARWSDVAWSGARWSGARWSGARWSAGSWDGARWSYAAWDGARWSDESWDGARWSGARWSGARWSGARWSGVRWK